MLKGLGTIRREIAFFREIYSAKQMLKAHLPSPAVPLFVRIQGEVDTTGTMSFRKVEMVREGFDIERVTDPIWFLEPGAGTYARLEHGHLERLRAGEYRL